MKCTFCDAVNVKVKAITYQGNPAMVCVSCELLDGVIGDKE